MKKIFPLLSLICLFSCKLELPEVEIPESQPAIDILVPESFEYNTSSSIPLSIISENTTDGRLTNVPFVIEYKLGDEWLQKTQGITNQDGFADIALNLPNAAEKLKVTTSYLGLPSEQTIDLTENNDLQVVLGQDNKACFTGEIDERFLQTNSSSHQHPNSLNGRNGDQFTYMGSYSPFGRPSYIEKPDDKIGQDLLDVVNASLPEYMPVPDFHPGYLGKVTTIHLVEEGDISITFVHEGTTNRNALGYYTYPTNSPPASADDIDEFIIIFPNLSYTGSGGDLNTGNKVKIGTFPAGTSVGWFLASNGWNESSNDVDFNDKNSFKYSDKSLNDFTDPANRQHFAFLHAQSEDLFLLGVEDTQRPDSDEDFNDAIFYVTVAPFSAIQVGDLAVADTNIDEDGDGVPDNVDAEPNDPTISFHLHTPAAGKYGTLAFEDLFPYQGDYDMNDFVIDYNFKEYTNAKDEALKMDISLKLRAVGGILSSGIGFEMNISPDMITSVTGQQLTGNNVFLAGNGTEKGQEHAVIIALDDCLGLFGGGTIINTFQNSAQIDPVNLELTVEYVHPIHRSELGDAPFNPFMFNQEERGKEIHLPGYTPTTLVNNEYFQTGDDATDLLENKYYKTVHNLPFAINIPISFDYMIEQSPINQGHLKFAPWAESGGAEFSDWYMNKSNYRVPNKIY